MSSVNLLKAKLYFPKCHSAMVRRPRLVDLLSECVRKPVTVVLAPAGYGKTVMASEWYARQKNGPKAAYVSLDSQDNEASVFVGYMALAFSNLGTDSAWADGCAACSNESDPHEAIARLASYLEEFQDNCVLFLDDYHLITNPEVHELLLNLIEFRLENVSFVIMGRGAVGIPVARWRLEGRLSEIGVEELTFTETEADELLGRFGKGEISDEESLLAKEEAEGWAAGLRLACLALSDNDSKVQLGMRAFCGSKYVWQYLWEEVFSQQPDEIQSFLLATSVADEINEPLCQKLLEAWSDYADEPVGNFKPSTALRYILDSGLFLVELAGGEGWYRYHHLLRDFVSRRLESEHPGARIALHKAASEWQLARGLETKAINQAMESGDWSYAAEVVTKVGLRALAKGWGQPVIEWMDALPHGVVDQDSELAVLRAWGYVLTSKAKYATLADHATFLAEERVQLADGQTKQLCLGHIDLIKAFRQLVPRLDGVMGVREEELVNTLALPATEDPRAAADLVLGWSALAHNELDRALDCMAVARELSLRAPHYFTFEEATFSAAYALGALGRTQEALTLCESSIELLRRSMALDQGETPLAGPLIVLKGHLLVSKGLFSEAQAYLDSGIQTVGGCLMPHYHLIGCVALFDMHELQGCEEGALAALRRMKSAWSDVAFCSDALRIEHALNRGVGGASLRQLEEEAGEYLLMAEKIAASLNGVSPLRGGFAYERAWLSWLRLMIGVGRQKKALELLDVRLKAYGENAPRCPLAQLLAIRAFALLADGQEEAATLQFHDAMQVAPSKHCFRTVALDGAFRILEAKEKARFASDDGHDVAPSTSKTSNALLTRKEVQVLKLAGRGLSNKGIASSLGIGEGTVKQHMNHAMTKLCAKNRTEAYLIAQEMGLLG